MQAPNARLEKTGVIAGYTVMLRQSPARQTLRSWMLVTVEKEADSVQLMQRMREIPGVGGIYLLTGELDFIVEAVAATPLAIDDVRTEVASIPGIADIRTHLVLRASLHDPSTSPSAVARIDEEASEVDS